MLLTFFRLGQYDAPELYKAFAAVFWLPNLQIHRPTIAEHLPNIF